ncbi:MAG: hypothetical protein RMY64_26460 [Nostoc sp. DedQUE08]|nr:hypothetical protein [Nostoc sp. DedQUE08]
MWVESEFNISDVYDWLHLRTLQTLCMYREFVTNFSNFSMSASTIRLSRSR